MALTCARCSAQNPEGNAFCQQCGAALAPVPAAQPPAPATPAAQPPQVTAPPTAAQPAPPPLPSTPPPHAAGRLSRNAIIAIAVVAILVIAGAVIVFAAIKHSPNVPPGPTAPPRPTSAPPTSGPTPRPTTAPTATPAPPSGGHTVDAGFATIQAPSGTSVAQQSQGHVEIDVDNASSGQFFFDALQPPSGVTDTSSLMSQQLGLFQNTQGNTGVDWCPDGGAPSAAQLPGDSGAISAQDGLICGTAASQNGQTYQFIAELTGAYVNGSNGPEAIVFTFYSTPDLFAPQQQQFETPILKNSVWHGVSS